ncbi:hypothetical protein CRUP_007585, partial [Coryphaenoides rupestris]
MTDGDVSGDFAKRVEIIKITELVYREDCPQKKKKEKKKKKKKKPPLTCSFSDYSSETSRRQTGTTWMQEIVPLIQAEGDPAAVRSLPNWERVPWLEQVFARTLNLEQRPSRLLTTHYHYSMMPASFFEVRPKGWLNADEKEHIFYISYEEMITDLKSAVTRLAQFMGKTLDSEVVEKIADRCVFENMKKNDMSNYSKDTRGLYDLSNSEFLRKGITGDWKNHLTAAEAEYFDSVYKDKMKD